MRSLPGLQAPRRSHALRHAQDLPKGVALAAPLPSPAAVPRHGLRTALGSLAAAVGIVVV